MPTDKSIFGLRFGSNAELQPTREELRVFLKSLKTEGKREPHGDDLASYREMLASLETFERERQLDAAPQNFRGKMFYGVLGQSCFFNSSLKSAVEQYEYHLRALITLDFRKPTAFIKSAEEELGRLNPKKKDDAIKLSKLQGMVDERKRAVELLRKRRAILAAELCDIARYIRDNLVKIEKLCEGSIVVLVDVQLRQKKENQLIEDVKTQFKERLRDSLHQGSITRQELESVKEDVNLLSKEISALIREDVYAMTGLFEAIHGHAKKIAREVDTLLAQTGGAGNRGFEEEAGLFAQIERALVSLVSEYRFELKAAEIRTQTAYEDIFLEIRRGMLAYLFDLLEKERRLSANRRSAADRRRFNAPNRKGLERRSGKDRRSGKNRRDQ